MPLKVVCKNCGYTLFYSEDANEITKFDPYNIRYCPNCGRQIKFNPHTTEVKVSIYKNQNPKSKEHRKFSIFNFNPSRIKNKDSPIICTYCQKEIKDGEKVYREKPCGPRKGRRYFHLNCYEEFKKKKAWITIWNIQNTMLRRLHQKFNIPTQIT